MAKSEWGQKRTCPSCSAHFYDLKKNPCHCPKCDNEFEPGAIVKKRRGRPPAMDKKAALKVDDTKDLIDDDLEIIDVDADDIIEDTSDLGDDDVIEVVTKSEDDE